MLAIAVYISVPCSFFINDHGPFLCYLFWHSGLRRFNFGVSSASARCLWFLPLLSFGSVPFLA
jgi:hypothetical protein